MGVLQIFISPAAVNIAVNACIAVGHTGATVTDINETREFAQKADGLLVNLGNLSHTTIPSMMVATQTFQNRTMPWVLDPVAVGATHPRLQAALDLLLYKPAIIRGNAAEIITLAHALRLTEHSGNSNGPDSLDSVESALGAAKLLAANTQSIVGVSGETDFVTDGHNQQRITGGHHLMPKVIGLGCAVSTIAAAFAVKHSPFEATIKAFNLAARAGERAGARAQGAGTFQMHWLDALREVMHDA